MISVSVQVDIEQAIRMLNLLPKEAERAAYRAINKIADEVAEDSAQQIALETGIPKGSRKEARAGGARGTVHGRIYVEPASRGRLIAVVRALPSAQNVGYYQGAGPRQTKPGVDVKAYGKRKVYDRAFVKGKARIGGGIPRKVWRRTGPGDNDITSKTYGPSIRKEFERPFLRARQMALINRRWPRWFEHYLRAEIRRLRGAEALRGVRNVLPTIQGPTVQ